MTKTYPAPTPSHTPHITADKYDAMYKGSLGAPDMFWRVQAERLDWFKKPTKIKNTDFFKPVSIKWFEDGVLNVSVNCIDRHLKDHADQVAIIWEGDEPTESKHITYAELHKHICKLANALLARGVQKGDRVTIYMPMVPEAAYAMLACTRIGAVHSVVFGGFSPEALRDRILDCGSKVIITADEGVRGEKIIPLKANTDKAVAECPEVETILVLKRTGGEINWNANQVIPENYQETIRNFVSLIESSQIEIDLSDNDVRALDIIHDSCCSGQVEHILIDHKDTLIKIAEHLLECVALGQHKTLIGQDQRSAKNLLEFLKTDCSQDQWWHDLVDAQEPICDPEPMNAEDPLFILYTSGSTGKPKGVLHTTGGYLLYASLTHECTFDYQEGDIYWCTADVGWVTGHSYIVYGPLANRATTLMFEGVPNYPDWGRFWEVVEKHKVNSFYTAPTAIRSLLKAGDEFVTKHDRSSLRILGTVGEPINHEAWEWYYHTVGEGRCPIVDTWWQTETGGHMMTPLPYANDLKPGAAMQPFFGVYPAIIDNEGHILEGEAEGMFCIMDSWPGQMRSLWGDHDRFELTYFSTFEGVYFTGDGARRDADGDYWITGRVDDVINVSGHRLGTAEIESAINEHTAIAESAIVGFPHEIKGQGVYAYVTLKEGFESSDTIKSEINDLLRTKIGPIAKCDTIQWAPALPKTRSGKIMRRILRNIAAGEYESLGDTSTLADPGVVEELIRNRA